MKYTFLSDFLGSPQPTPWRKPHNWRWADPCQLNHININFLFAHMAIARIVLSPPPKSIFVQFHA